MQGVSDQRLAIHTLPQTTLYWQVQAARHTYVKCQTYVLPLPQRSSQLWKQAAASDLQDCTKLCKQFNRLEDRRTRRSTGMQYVLDTAISQISKYVCLAACTCQCSVVCGKYVWLNTGH